MRWRVFDNLRGQFVGAALLLILLPSVALHLFVVIQIRRFVSEQVYTLAEDSLSYADDNMRALVDIALFARNQVLSEVIQSGILSLTDDRSNFGLARIRNLVHAVYTAQTGTKAVSSIQVVIHDNYRVTADNFARLETNPVAVGRELLYLSANESVAMLENGFLYRTIVGGNGIGTDDSGSITEVQLVLSAAEVARIVRSAIFSDSPHVNSYLVGATGEVLVSPNSRHLLGQSIGETVGVSDYVLGSGRVQGESSVVLSRAVTGLPIHLVTEVEKALFDNQIRRVQGMALLLGIGVLIVSVAAAFLTAERLTDGLYSVLNSMDRVGRGDFEHRLNAEAGAANRDLRRLVTDFNVMIDRINVLMSNAQEQERISTLTQIRALQAQINPHFLYNTLDLIRGLAGARKTEEIKETAASLADLFRYSIDRQDEPVRLSDEIDSLDNYLRIQYLRFDQQVSVEVTISDGAAQCVVPRLILQPLVENCFRHGIAELLRPAKISLSAWIDRERDDLIVRVADTGVGIRPERLAQIRETLYGPSRTSERANSEESHYGLAVGLRNVHRRLQLLYGERAGLSIDGVPDQGTTVRIVLAAEVP